MPGVLDFLREKAGEGRDWFNDTAEYYTPPGLRPLMGLLADMTPTAGMERAGQASQRMFEPGRGGWDRVGDLGTMLSETAGVAAPVMVANRAAVPAGQAVMDALVGMSMNPTATAGRAFALDEAGEMDVPGLLGRLGHNGGPSMDPFESVDMAPHTAKPTYAGAAPVRTETFPRYRPKKTSARMERLLSQIDNPENPIHGIFDRYIEKGKTLGGPDWYNTEELRDWFVNALGDTEGDAQWREYMDLIGTTSTGAKVPHNIRSASFYRALNPDDRLAVAKMVSDDGISPQLAAERLGIEVPNMPENPAYGHLKQRNQASNVVNLMEGKWARTPPPDLKGAALTKWLQANPKVKGFGNDLQGDPTNIAADMHFMRMLAMADGGVDFLSDKAGLSADNLEALKQAYGPRKISRYVTTRKVNGKPMSTVNLKKAAQDGVIKDTEAMRNMPTAWADTPGGTEYAAYEDMANRVAEKYGMTPAQFQASLWMGAGDITGLADESQGTFMELFRRSLDKRAGERGLSRKEMLNEFIRNRAPLMVPGGILGAGALSGGGEEDQPLLGGNI